MHKDHPTVTAGLLSVPIALDQIQGNSIGGFLKDRQAFVFMRITDPQKAAATIRGSPIGDSKVNGDSILACVNASTSEKVLHFNAQFKLLKTQGGPQASISATWTNLVLTMTGLRKLGKSQEELAQMPDAFIQGMKMRADKLGDLGNSAPENWEKIVDWDSVDAMIIVASDERANVDGADPNGRLGRYLAAITASESGLELCASTDASTPTHVEAPGLLYGESREDEPGHEHFGWRDHVSQPAIRGIDLPDDPVANPHQGCRGQHLLHPGEFVVGYPRQRPTGLPGFRGPNPIPSQIMSGDGPITSPRDRGIDPLGSLRKLPRWATNGSFLVFRRLEQDVLGFQNFVRARSVELGMSEELLGAKLIGRFKDGAPLERRHVRDEGRFPDSDHNSNSAELGEAEPAKINLRYGDDTDGEVVPLAAHIRKVYPRDQIQYDERGHPVTELGDRLELADAESRVETHRILRRGLPYGKSLRKHPSGKSMDKRGLLFLAYQSDIERQFEFIQRAWVLDPHFPAINAGQDPLVTPQKKDVDLSSMSFCPFHESDKAGRIGLRAPCKTGIQRFVKTQGGGYFFSASINTLFELFGATRP